MRIKCGKNSRKRKKRILRECKGFRGGRGNLFRQAVVTLIRSRVYAYRDRKVRKREFRKLWILRINAAVRQRGMSYSVFINGLKLAGLLLNRKMLSELAINVPDAFDEIFAIVKEAVAKKQAALAVSA